MTDADKLINVAYNLMTVSEGDEMFEATWNILLCAFEKYLREHKEKEVEPHEKLFSTD
jgi:hypothetical protein